MLRQWCSSTKYMDCSAGASARQRLRAPAPAPPRAAVRRRSRPRFLLHGGNTSANTKVVQMSSDPMILPTIIVQSQLGKSDAQEALAVACFCAFYICEARISTAAPCVPVQDSQAGRASQGRCLGPAKHLGPASQLQQLPKELRERSAVSTVVCRPPSTANIAHRHCSISRAH